MPWLKILGVGGIISALLAAYFQYNQWRAEQDLSREKYEYENSTSTYNDIGNALGPTITLQTRLYFLFKDSASTDNLSLAKFNFNNASNVYKRYLKAWDSLQDQFGALVQKTALYIDRPADASSSAIPRVATVVQLDDTEFDCANNVSPDTVLIKAKSNYNLDWTILSNHVVTIYFCLKKAHEKMLHARQWAASASFNDSREFKVTQNGVQGILDAHAERFDSFLVRSRIRLNTIQQRYEKSYSFVCLFPFVSRLVCS